MSMAPCIYWIDIYITKEPGLPPGPCYVSTCARGFEPLNVFSDALFSRLSEANNKNGTKVELLIFKGFQIFNFSIHIQNMYVTFFLDIFVFATRNYHALLLN